MGRATDRQISVFDGYPISIHALRGEGDCTKDNNTDQYQQFQSTPSVGRATGYADERVTKERFQSTPSVGRATRGGGDAQHLRLYFNPRPPWGGRLQPEAEQPAWKRFQSTPSVGRATHDCHTFLLECCISIHALRGEGDSPSIFCQSVVKYFNPRPPWGGRR